MIFGIIVLDTNVISEAMRPAPSPDVLNWLTQQQTGALFITTVTVAEILYGIELLPHGKRRDAFVAGSERMFGKVLAGRILPFDEDAARTFPEIAIRRRREGRPISNLDGQIAAIARSRGALLATRNIADFEGCGVRLVNPWQHAGS